MAQARKSTNVPRVRKSIADRREVILEVASKLFSSRGFTDVTISDVIKEAGGSYATIYREFGDKEGLFRAVLERHMGRVIESWPTLQAGQDFESTAECLREFAVAYLKSVLDPLSGGFHHILVREIHEFSSPQSSGYAAGDDRVVQHLATFFEKADKEGFFNISNPVWAAEGFLGMVRGEYLFRLDIGFDLHEFTEELTAYANFVVSLFLRGVEHKV